MMTGKPVAEMSPEELAQELEGIAARSAPDDQARLRQVAAAVRALGSSAAQLTSFLLRIYSAIGAARDADPTRVLARISTLAKRAQSEPAPTRGYVAFPAVAGIALAALLGGGLGGYYARGKLGGGAAEENPVKGPPMESGYALKRSGDQWTEVIVGPEQVRGAKFVGWQDVDGEKHAVWKYAGAAYAQVAVGPRHPSHFREVRRPRMQERSS